MSLNYGPQYTYDMEADIAYVELEDGECSRSVHLSDTIFGTGAEIEQHIMLDLSSEGVVLGIEIQNASKAFSLSQASLSQEPFKVPMYILGAMSKGFIPNPTGT